MNKDNRTWIEKKIDRAHSYMNDIDDATTIRESYMLMGMAKEAMLTAFAWILDNNVDATIQNISDMCYTIERCRRNDIITGDEATYFTAKLEKLMHG